MSRLAGLPIIPSNHIETDSRQIDKLTGISSNSYSRPMHHDHDIIRDGFRTWKIT